MSSPEPPAETLAPDIPTWSKEPTYSNLGEIRTHLLPSKACRLRALGSPSDDLKPPPLPKKTLTRTKSLPTYGTPGPSPAHARQPRRPLLGSRSVDKSQEAENRVSPASFLEELTFSTPDTELGCFFQDLNNLEAVHDTLAARQLASLSTIHARLHTRLLGGHPGPCNPSHSFRLLDDSPYVDSGDAIYYRVVRVNKDAWHILAAKVPKPGSEVPDPWGLELQASLSPHFNLQSLCGLVSERVLPAAPWRGPATLVAEVPERTVAQWLAEVGVRRPPEFSRAAALLLLQLSAALERLEARDAALVELRPENLLLATPRGCATTGPQRLLLADFGRVHPRPTGVQGAHARPLGSLLQVMLCPAATPPDTPLATGLRRLGAQLLRRLPSAAQTRAALQALLWGPGPALRGPGAPLGPWLRVRRALLVLRLAEHAAGGEELGLEDWLCCEYLAEATEGSLAHALALLWD
ncbi:protein PEAK3 [Elephas maximus indicus]|uniref:protein PEAK3 n=1 Tax=Elephas maximus indicus TaxID=99487 RepID=UPI002116B4DB|nr:protein PEAK3 [Elephas maximus indicus]